VVLNLFDMRGRAVQTLAVGPFAAGSHTVVLDAHWLPTGIYFARLEAAGITRTQKLLLLK
jgi:hypothetical protein